MQEVGVVTDENGRRLLGARNTVAGVIVQGDLGWRKWEERREEMKVKFRKRLEVLEERLVKKSGWGNRLVGRTWGLEEKV